jgi:hypothetical protein
LPRKSADQGSFLSISDHFDGVAIAETQTPLPAGPSTAQGRQSMEASTDQRNGRITLALNARQPDLAVEHEPRLGELDCAEGLLQR